MSRRSRIVSGILFCVASCACGLLLPQTVHAQWYGDGYRGGYAPYGGGYGYHNAYGGYGYAPPVYHGYHNHQNYGYGGYGYGNPGYGYGGYNYGGGYGFPSTGYGYNYGGYPYSGASGYGSYTNYWINRGRGW